jgi:hypothetical protein
VIRRIALLFLEPRRHIGVGGQRHSSAVLSRENPAPTLWELPGFVKFSVLQEFIASVTATRLSRLFPLLLYLVLYMSDNISY